MDANEGRRRTFREEDHERHETHEKQMKDEEEFPRFESRG